MRVLLLYAHPSKTSFCAGLHREVATTLSSRGHEVDDCDLYEEAFDPVLSNQEWINYRDTAVNRAPVARYVDRLLACDALVLVYPVWNEGFPAILKGFLDRVFLPGVSFDTKADGALAPALGNINRLAAVCAYGSNRLSTMLLGDPPRRVVKRLLSATPGHSVRCDYLACYGMNDASQERRASFLTKVRRRFETW